MTEKRGSAGGKACAIIQKEQAKRRIDEYNLSPNICLNCGKQILANYNQHLSDIKKIFVRENVLITIIRKICKENRIITLINNHLFKKYLIVK